MSLNVRLIKCLSSAQSHYQHCNHIHTAVIKKRLRILCLWLAASGEKGKFLEKTEEIPCLK